MSFFRMKTYCSEHRLEHWDNEQCPKCFREQEQQALLDIAEESRLSREESERQFAANEAQRRIEREADNERQEQREREREEDNERREREREEDNERREREREDADERREREREDADERAALARHQAANPGDHECPSCLFLTLKRSAKRCPKCHGDVPPSLWLELAERERKAEEAAERQRRIQIMRERPQRHAEELGHMRVKAHDAGYKSVPFPFAESLIGERINSRTNKLTAEEFATLGEAYKNGIAQREENARKAVLRSEEEARQAAMRLLAEQKAAVQNHNNRLIRGWLILVFYASPIFLNLVLLTHQFVAGSDFSVLDAIWDFVGSFVPALNQYVTWIVFAQWDKFSSELPQLWLAVSIAGAMSLLFGFAIHKAMSKKLRAAFFSLALAVATFGGFIWYDLHVIAPAWRAVTEAEASRLEAERVASYLAEETAFAAMKAKAAGAGVKAEAPRAAEVDALNDASNNNNAPPQDVPSATNTLGQMGSDVVPTEAENTTETATKKNAAAFPAEDEVERMMKEYYATKGQFARVFVIDRVEKLRVEKVREDLVNVHAQYSYAPAPDQKSTWRTGGNDQRVFKFKLKDGVWTVIGLTGAKSARL